ncbi:RidA family protein [Epibacterium sp. Ofav1-8]|uniref:RidA family protein n=1 Tax=Epibacterium sp. Ofav1-8 TaxID=2917735 RepID=UPI001EF62B9C|nr:RidA family protein [Epibacterium sp. Ofav1-8]MCG7625154.1 RidA family protein [Epibacterium sp. Ofav1-8]
MSVPINPKSIAPPASHYNHGFYIPAGAAIMTLSGQLGEHADGYCPEDAGEQARIAWHNIKAILAEKGFGVENVVKVTSYIVGEENIDPYVAVHREIVGDHMPPWTLVAVPALGRPQYKIEVDVMAAG